MLKALKREELGELLGGEGRVNVVVVCLQGCSDLLYLLFGTLRVVSVRFASRSVELTTSADICLHVSTQSIFKYDA